MYIKLYNKRINNNNIIRKPITDPAYPERTVKRKHKKPHKNA